MPSLNLSQWCTYKSQYLHPDSNLLHPHTATDKSLTHRFTASCFMFDANSSLLIIFTSSLLSSTFALVSGSPPFTFDSYSPPIPTLAKLGQYIYLGIAPADIVAPSSPLYCIVSCIRSLPPNPATWHPANPSRKAPRRCRLIRPKSARARKRKQIGPQRAAQSVSRESLSLIA